MIDISTLQILSYLVIILIICLLPVYLLRRNWKETFLTGSVFVYSYILYRQFLWGKFGTYHDSLQHKFLLLTLKQWLDSYVSIGWNPYMNGGEPLYLFSNSFLYSPWVVFCSLNAFIHLNPDTLFNIFWFFQFLCFCTGAFLIFLIIFDNFRVAFFCLMSLVLSGMFIVNLGQPTGLNIIWFFPYVIFCLIFAFKKRNVNGLFLAMFFLGLAINNYNPLYIVLSVGIFALFFALFHRVELFRNRHTLKLLRPRKILFGLAVFFMIISPILFLYSEFNDYVSPTRGGRMVNDGIRTGREGLQPNVNAPLWGYKVFLEQIISYRDNIHHAFYIGIIPLLLIPIAFFQWRNRYLWVVFFSIIAFFLLGLGNDFAGYRFLLKYVPGFNMIRHSFGFAHFTSFFLIIFSGYGLTELLRQNRKFSESAVLLILTACFIFFLFCISNSAVLFNFGISAALIIILLFILEMILYKSLRKCIYPIFYISLLILLIIDLTLFTFQSQFRPMVSMDFMPIKYPQTRAFFSSTWWPPPDFSPFIFKKSVVTPGNDHFVMFRNKRFDKMLKFFPGHQKCQATLGSEIPLIFFTPFAEIFSGESEDENIMNIYKYDFLRLDSANSQKVFFSRKDIDFVPFSASGSGITGHSVIPRDSYNPNKVEIIADVPSEGFLVYLENFHKYWQAWIDGRKTKIYRANYAFQAIRVPSGRHNIIFEFNSPYPVLFWAHVILAAVIWGMFNFFLYQTYCEKTEDKEKT